MKLRSALAAVGLVALIVTAGCTGMLTTQSGSDASSAPADRADGVTDGGPAASSDAVTSSDRAGTPGARSGAAVRSGSSRTIDVAASGRVQAQPNQAVLRIGVRATGHNASVVRRRIAENVSRMRAALSEAGIGSDQITTAYYDISTNRRFERRENDEPAFRGRHAFSITLTEPDRAGEIIVIAVENGATDVDDVEFTLSEDRRRELRKEALADAIESARAQAGILASGAELSITGVGAIRTADVGYRPVRFEGAALAAGDGGGGTTIKGGSVTVTAQVQVTYNATAEE